MSISFSRSPDITQFLRVLRRAAGSLGLYALAICPILATPQIAAAASGSPAAQPQTHVNTVRPETLDIRALRLYATPESILAQLTALAAEAKAEHIVPIRRECTREHLAAMERQEFNGNPDPACIESYELHGSAFSAVVDFVEDFPANPGVMRAFRIDVRPQLDTPLQREAYAQFILKRYGKPTIGTVRTEASYCARPIRSDENTPATCPAGPTLLRRGNALILVDLRYQKIRRGAIDRAVRLSGVRQVTF